MDIGVFDYKDYYKRFKELREQIKNKEATWSDMEALRLEYIGMTERNSLQCLDHYSGNTLRQGCKMYDEFMRYGVIKDNENKGDNVNNDISGRSVKDEVQIIPKCVQKNKDGTTVSEIIINIDVTKMNSEEDLLKAHGLNPDEFELVSTRSTLWKQGTKGGDKNLYSSKITAKKKAVIDTKVFYEEVAKRFEELGNKKLSKTAVDSIKPEVKIKKDIRDRNVLVVSYNDLHWGRYCAEADYDEEYSRILDTADGFIKKLDKDNYEKVVLVLGSDFFNSDCYGYTTIHKNKQSNWGDFKDIFATGVTLCTDLIDKFRNWVGDVEVYFVPGNHGNNEDFVLGKCIESYYHNDIYVNINAYNAPRKYFYWENTLIGFTHGDKEKSNLGNIMAVEMPDEWASTGNRFWITGHYHSLKETIIESNGVTIFTCPSIAIDDEYTYERGYTSECRVMAFTVNAIHGLTDTHYVYS